MIKDQVELTMSHLGLGKLGEFALMVLFGNAHGHHLVHQRENTPNEIVDHQGHVLYPAYFMTHLKVSPRHLLRGFDLWQQVHVACDVQRFGDTILDSTYCLGPIDQVPEDPADWPECGLPWMHGNNLIVVVVREEDAPRKVSIPKPETIADLPKLRRPPQALTRAREIRAKGFEINPIQFRSEEPLPFQVVLHRDAAPGHAMIFAKFSEIMDLAEFSFLTKGLIPGMPEMLVNHLHLLERETFYYGNCFAGEELLVYLEGNIEQVDAAYHGPALDIISAARLEMVFQVVRKRNNALLAMARVKKLMALPTSAQEHVLDLKRFMAQLADKTTRVST